MIIETEESIKFFSSQKKPDREKTTCSAFLKCLGIDFNLTDLKCIKNDPPDIQFLTANFEIKEYLDDQRKRHYEYKRLLEKLLKAHKLSDLMEPYSAPKPLAVKYVGEKISIFLEEYSKIYGKKLCSTLDALIYFNLNGYYINDTDVSVDVQGMRNQGWKSVSIVSNLLAFIFYAHDSAPEFLKNNIGMIKHEWKGTGLFDIN